MQKEKVDLILYNGNVYTVDTLFSKAEAFAVKDGQFVGIGNNEQILEKYEADSIINANGKSVYPGFMDGHCHFVGYGTNLIRYADLTGCQSFDEVLQRLQKHEATHPSEWILGRGWDQNLWSDKSFPNNERLSELFPDKKVVLTRIDGHAVLANKEVLALASIDANSKIEGGFVEVSNGLPTGILLDNAADKAKDLIPDLSNTELTQALLLAQKNCFSVGLSGVTDAGLSIHEIQTIDSLQQNGSLSINVNAMINPDATTLRYYFSQGPIMKEKLTVRSVKLYADGALGSRGAKLLQPYSDKPETSGLMLFSDDFYDSICAQAYQAGFQVCTHAIGDAGVEKMLQIYSKFLPEENDLRWRIEHSQVVDKDDFNKFKEFGIIPSIQSTHCTSDMSWAESRLGSERIKYAYAQKLLLSQNGWLINGTDFPIENINPLYTFYAAVARKDLFGQPNDGFQMENALSREEALRSITSWVAKGYFAENRKGSIEIGKDADFVILENDIMKVPENLIPTTKVTNLYLSGKMVYTSNY